MLLKHELWKIEHSEGSIEHAFFPASEREKQRLDPRAKLIWTVEAISYAHAMTKYYEFMDFGEFYAMDIEDWKPYT